MTLLSQLSLFQAKNTDEKKSATMNALALMVFVLLFFISTVAHADHITTQVTNAEQQECYICHQGIDTPPELSQIHTVFVASFAVNPPKAVTVQFKVNNFIQPPLRAPPVFQ
jgi:hypothetical protein